MELPAAPSGCCIARAAAIEANAIESGCQFVQAIEWVVHLNPLQVREPRFGRELAQFRLVQVKRAQALATRGRP